MFGRRLLLPTVAVCLSFAACKRPAESASPSAAKSHLVGLVTDVGGRGDQSFNDSALRGLELWAAGARYASGGYQKVPLAEVQQSLSTSVSKKGIAPLPVTPLVMLSKVQEDYEPNLQLLVDQGAELVIATGFMLENAVEAVARRNPKASFLLIDSPILDASGAPTTLPNVRSVVFREEEGSFLVGALAALVSKKKLGFVGGMEIPLIKKFESGFIAGARAARPGAQVLATYTGSFDKVAAGKQVAQDLIAKGADVLFHAAGSDGLGVIQAVREARAAGAEVYAIGVDSDQSALAPEAMLTSMIKRIDLVVYEATRDLSQSAFSGGDRVLGLKDDGVGYAEVKLDFPGKAEALAKVEALRAQVIDGQIKVPSNAAELTGFKP